MSFCGFTDNKYTLIYIPKEKDMSLESDTFKKSQIAHKVAVIFFRHRRMFRTLSAFDNVSFGYGNLTFSSGILL